MIFITLLNNETFSSKNNDNIEWKWASPTFSGLTERDVYHYLSKILSKRGSY